MPENWASEDLRFFQSLIELAAFVLPDLSDFQPEVWINGSLRERFRGLEHQQNGFSFRQKIAVEEVLVIWDHYLELRRQNIQDPLTGLYNRRAFQQRLTEETLRAQRHGTRLSLLMMDVDFFKLYNDHYGHPAGDEVLRRVAQVLRESCRASDVLVRYGGEEFVVLLPETGLAGGLQLAKKFIQNLKSAHIPHEARKDDLTTLSMSIGLAIFDPKQAQPLLKQADLALYRAKKNGRNQVMVYQDNFQDGI